MKFFAVGDNGELLEHEESFHLKPEPETVIQCADLQFQPQAALPNSSNLGYARVLLDEASLAFFTKNLKLLTK